MIRQLSVFIENKQGSLAETAGILAAKKINVSAMTLADTSKYGVLRMIVDDIDAAIAALTEAGYIARANDVVAVKMPDTAGALHDVIDVLDQVGVNVEYLYPSTTAAQAPPTWCSAFTIPPSPTRPLPPRASPFCKSYGTLPTGSVPYPYIQARCFPCNQTSIMNI